MNSKLHFEILPTEQKQLFDVLARQQWLRSFYLAGGTSLALHIGHRRSIDFDFFTRKDFDNRSVVQTLSGIGAFELFSRSPNTVDGSLNAVKVSFLAYPYPILEPFLERENILIADMLDIALMKLEAIAGRGSKKDFIDLYYLLNYYSLPELLEKHKAKYGAKISNQYHLLKSLAYFDDAEHEAMPEMMERVDWDDVKKRITREVQNLRL